MSRTILPLVGLVAVVVVAGCGGGTVDGTRWNTLTDEALQAVRQRRFTEALTKTEEALQVAKAVFGEKHENVARSHAYLGRIHQAMGEALQAEVDYKNAIEISESARPGANPDLAAHLQHFAEFLAQNKRFSEAIPLLERALTINRVVFGPKHRNVGVLHHMLGELYAASNDFAKASEQFSTAFDIVQTVEGPLSPNQMMPLNSLAMAQIQLGNFDEAERLFKKAQSIVERAAGPDAPANAMIYEGLAAVYEKQNKLDLALRQAERSLLLAEQNLGPTDPRVAGPLQRVAGLLRKLGRNDDAAVHERRFEALRQRAQSSGATTATTGP